MPPISAKWNRRRGAAADRFRRALNRGGRQEPRRVGFGRSFGVKLGVLWAVEGTLPAIFGNGKRFKKLLKLTGKGEAAKGDAYHIDRSEAHLGLSIRPVTPGPRVFAAQDLRNPSHVGRLGPTCKIGISL